MHKLAYIGIFLALIGAGGWRGRSAAPHGRQPATASSAFPLWLPAVQSARETRDRWKWPFSQDSIWNMPIGSAARYAPAGLPDYWLTVETDWMFKAMPSDPLRPLYYSNSWTDRCRGSTPAWIPQIRINDAIIVPDAVTDPSAYFTPNNAAAFLQPDGHTLLQVEPLARCAAGGPVFGIPQAYAEADLLRDGRRGTHYGSGLSAIGGTVRQGELTNDAPIRHALKVVLSESLLYYNASDSTKGYRWPATTADSGAAQAYSGTNPQIEMGTLLALPPGVTPAGLGLKTRAATKLFHAFQNYGAYVVDSTTTADRAHYIALEQGVAAEFKDAYGYDFGGGSQDFHRDIDAIFQALNIVTNNDADAVGGGGSPRSPLAPAFEPQSLFVDAVRLHTAARLCLEISGGSQADGARLIQSHCRDSASQRFFVETRNDGYFIIRNSNSGKCLDVSAQSTAVGASIQQWQCADSANQLWRISDLGDFSYALRARHSGKCIGAPNQSQSAGTALQQAECSSPAATFRLAR